MARKEGQLEVALNAARLAIGAFPALFDVVEELSSPGREPRAELWLAVAERAQREGNREILEQAIERADIAASEADVTQDDFHLLAAIREVQVSAGDMLRLPPDDRVAHLVEAGTYRVAAGLIDHGRLDFERALELEPEHVEASWRLADCLVASAWVEPYSQAQPLIQQAGRLLARGRSQRVPEGLGWKFLTDASLERLRARALSKRARRRTWRALLATCRGILHDPAGSQPWIDLSTTAANLGMALLAEAAARYAIELEPDSEDANDALANALSERGDFAGALELTVPGSGPFQEASRGYFLLRLGRFPEALAALRSVAVNPDWGWAVETMMTALLLTGDDAGARSEAHKALAGGPTTSRSATSLRLPRSRLLSLVSLMSRTSYSGALGPRTATQSGCGPLRKRNCSAAMTREPWTPSSNARDAPTPDASSLNRGQSSCRRSPRWPRGRHSSSFLRNGRPGCRDPAGRNRSTQ